MQFIDHLDKSLALSCNQQPKWKMSTLLCACVCVWGIYKHKHPKRRGKSSEMASAATCLPWLPRQQQSEQSIQGYPWKQRCRRRVNEAKMRRDFCRKPYMSATLYPALSAAPFLHALADRETIRCQRSHFLLSVQLHSGSADFWESVVVFVFSAQADDKVRLETRDSAHFDFASAMSAVTEFYCHSQEKGVFPCRRVPSSPSSTLRSYHVVMKSQSRPWLVAVALSCEMCFCGCVLQALASCRAWRPWRPQWSAVWGHSFSTSRSSTWREFCGMKGRRKAGHIQHRPQALVCAHWSHYKGKCWLI